MSLHNKYKIKNLIENWPNGTVATSLWLEKMGVGRQLRNRYKKSGWIESIYNGVFKKSGDDVGWEGAVYGLQQGKDPVIHPGALSSIALTGASHYIRMGRENLFLFAPSRTFLPKWIQSGDWGVDVKYSTTSFLPPFLGMVDYKVNEYSISISSLERSILECLYLAPKEVDLVECYQIMEGLATLRPKLLQELLEQCTSIKVTRLFLYMSEKANHAWFKHLDQNKFDSGKGDRCIVRKGVYIPNYKITIPRELFEYE